MSFERRRIIGPTERTLSPAEVLARTESTLQIVDRVCHYEPWSNITDQAILFGSLARKKGYSDSDVDVAFLSKNKLVANINDYLELATELRHTVDKCREIFGAYFFINPLLVLQTWYEPGNRPYIIPAVLEDIKNEGILIWSK